MTSADGPVPKRIEVLGNFLIEKLVAIKKVLDDHVKIDDCCRTPLSLSFTNGGRKTRFCAKVAFDGLYSAIFELQKLYVS